MPFPVVRSFLLAFTVALTLFGQAAETRFTSTIIAGGGPPDGAVATSVALFGATGVAVDGSGNFYYVSPTQHRVYKVAANGIVTVVAGNATRGYSGDGGPATAAQLNQPNGIAVDSLGNVYIADTQNCRLRKVAGGLITTVAGTGICAYQGDGPATRVPLMYPFGVAADSAGNIFIADYFRVRKISAGVISTVAGDGNYGSSGDGGQATSAQFAGATSVALDGGGNLYIIDRDNFRIRKVASGVISTVAGTGTRGDSGDGGLATNAQINYNATGLAVDSAGNVYFADSNNRRVRKIAGGVISTVAGNGFLEFSGDGGPATAASVANATGVAVDSTGSLYIADGNNRIRRVTGGVIQTVAGNGTYGYSGDGGSATNAQLRPRSVAVDGAGNLYAADGGHYRIRKIQGGAISTLAGNGAVGFSGDGGPASSAMTGDVSGVAVDGTGAVYLSDNSRIRKVVGGAISTIAGTGSSGYSGDGGPATSAQLSYSAGIAADSSGTVYVADQNRIRKISGGVITVFAGRGPLDGTLATTISIDPAGAAADGVGNVYFAAPGHHRIYKVAANGTISTFAGDGTAGVSGDNGLATSAQLSNPTGVALDAVGTVYVAENGRIRRIAGGLITTLAGGGSGCAQQTNSVGDGCPATGVNLSPSSVAVDSLGNVYIAGNNDGRVRKVSGGVISTAAGTGESGYSGDGGPATRAQLSNVTALAIDSLGNLYIADSGNQRIRKVSGGQISTIAGTGTSGYSGDGGPATGAQITRPEALAVDGSGNIYFADLYNSRIRMIAGGVISTVAGNGIGGFSGDGGPATNAQIGATRGVAVDSAGNLFISDQAVSRLRRVSGGLISTIAGNGYASFSGDGGLALNAQLGYGGALAVDHLGTVYYTDIGNNRIRAISASGTITTFAGGGAQSAGLATDVRLNSPRRVAVDGNRNVFIVENSPPRLRMVNQTSGTIRTLTQASEEVAADKAGNIYLPDESGNIRKLSPTNELCTYSLSSAPTGTVLAAGGSLTVMVDTSAGCSWQVSTAATWISVDGATSGIDTGSAVLSINPNVSASARTGTVQVGGQSITITQTAAPCTFGLGTSMVSVPAAGQTGSVTLTATGTACAWTSLPDASFVQTFPGSGDVGSTTISYTVFPNFTPRARTAVVRIGLATLTVNQAASSLNANERFVSLLYFSFLGRLPSAGELAAGVLTLNTGTTRQDLAMSFFNSLEFNNAGRYIGGLYVGLLNRDAEYNGWLFQRNAMATGFTNQQSVVTNFLEGPEFGLNGVLSNDNFVRLLYRQILLREAAPTEVAFQAGALATVSRTQVASNFLNSTEFRISTGPRLTAFLLYACLLQRDPGAAERSAMVAQVSGGAVIRDLVAGFLNSLEFQGIVN